MPRKRFTPDAELLIERLNELDPETAVMVLVEEYLGRAALVTPSASPRGWQGGMPLVPAWCIDHAEMEVVWQGHHIPVRAAPPEPVGGREPLLAIERAARVREDAEEAAADYDAQLHEAWSETGEQADDEQEERRGRLANELAQATLDLRAALQASPPTGVSDGVALDDQCPERCLGIVGHAGPHQTSDYEPRADVPGWMLSDIKARDAQTEPTPDRALPLGQSGTKYDHARRQTSTYHLDSPDVAMGDRHVLLHGWTGPQPIDPQPAMGVPVAHEQADSEPQGGGA